MSEGTNCVSPLFCSSFCLPFSYFFFCFFFFFFNASAPARARNKTDETFLPVRRAKSLSNGEADAAIISRRVGCKNKARNYAQELLIYWRPRDSGIAKVPVGICALASARRAGTGVKIKARGKEEEGARRFANGGTLIPEAGEISSAPFSYFPW